MRDDSTIEIHLVEDLYSRSSMMFEIKESETITGVIIGNVSSTKFKEIIFTCYSGAVKTLVHKRQLAKMGTLTEDA